MEVCDNWQSACLENKWSVKRLGGSSPSASALIQKETPIKLGEVTVGNQCVVTYLSVSLIKAKHQSCTGQWNVSIIRREQPARSRGSLLNFTFKLLDWGRNPASPLTIQDYGGTGRHVCLRSIFHGVRVRVPLVLLYYNRFDGHKNRSSIREEQTVLLQ